MKSRKISLQFTDIYDILRRRAENAKYIKIHGWKYDNRILQLTLRKRKHYLLTRAQKVLKLF